MGLLNYTTSISVEKTVGEMQTALAKAGAATIAVQYSEGAPRGLTFQLRTPYGPKVFTMPVDVLAVQRVLRKQRPGGGMSTAKFHSTDHAARVAWRIAKAWLEAQLALVTVQMATLDQIFLPYLLVDGDKTLYAAYQENESALQLTPGGAR
jgi:hypothetical protein